MHELQFIVYDGRLLIITSYLLSSSYSGMVLRYCDVNFLVPSREIRSSWQSSYWKEDMQVFTHFINPLQLTWLAWKYCTWEFFNKVKYWQMGQLEGEVLANELHVQLKLIVKGIGKTLANGILFCQICQSSHAEYFPHNGIMNIWGRWVTQNS